MWFSNDRGFRNGGMADQGAFHFGCAEPIARDLDHVIGKPHKTVGESIKAFIILKQGETESPALIKSIKDQVLKELGKIGVPSEIDIVSALPKTRSGKIMRRVLKAKELGQDPGDISTIEE